MLGLEGPRARGPMWVDTGSEQLVIPLASADAVDALPPRSGLFAKHGSNAIREGMAYVGRTTARAGVARFFFLNTAR